MSINFIELTQIAVLTPDMNMSKIVGKISFSPDAIFTFGETRELYPPKGFYEKDEISRDISTTMIRLKDSKTNIFVAENYEKVKHAINSLTDFINLSRIDGVDNFYPISINPTEITYFEPDVLSDAEPPIEKYAKLIDENQLADYPTSIMLKSGKRVTVAECYEYIQELLEENS